MPPQHHDQVEAKVIEQSPNGEEVSPLVSTENSGLKVLFLSSDTGGGHRASAESLAKQFQLQYPGSTYDILDIISEHGCPPYNTLVPAYKHLSSHPWQWEVVYNVSNTKTYEMVIDVHLKLMCERSIRRSIKSYNPDVVVSVHPLMNYVPVVSCHKISAEMDKHLPMFTVVTDLGSGHCLWFANEVEKMFIASDQIRKLAKNRGRVPDEKLVQSGLPIRHEFAIQAEKLGDRMSKQGKKYQLQIRRNLELNDADNVKTVLVMGGGEGVGSLSSIVDALYVQMTKMCINATIVVVCGRNERLRLDLAERNWDEVLERSRPFINRLGKGFQGILSNIPFLSVESNAGLSNLITNSPFNPMPDPAPNTLMLVSAQNSPEKCKTPIMGKVDVVGLGFVSQMAEYMVAADVLITKAGPGTIAEAAAVGLPVMLTSYLPGQEEGNIDFVVDGGFGLFRTDDSPAAIAEELSRWLTDADKLRAMSSAAMAVGAPNAASDIVSCIGESTLRWQENK